jgi:Tfp pilus assembly protein PilX
MLSLSGVRDRRADAQPGVEADLTMTNPTMLPQRGVALPVMLIMLVVMLLGSLYLMKSSHNSSLVTANLAYDSALSRAVDLGLLTGTNWLSTTAGANKALLDDDSSANGYLASIDPAQSVNSAAFWVGKVTLTDTASNTIEYVIHRMCSLSGRYDKPGPPANACVQTTANLGQTGSVQLGESLASDAQDVAPPPQIHYVVTARIFGPRGGNVVNQVVVMIGA